MAGTPEMPRLRSVAEVVHSAVEVAHSVARTVLERAGPVGILALRERTDICCALAVHEAERQSGPKLHPRFSGAPWGVALEWGNDLLAVIKFHKSIQILQ